MSSFHLLNLQLKTSNLRSLQRKAALSQHLFENVFDNSRLPVILQKYRPIILNALLQPVENAVYNSRLFQRLVGFHKIVPFIESLFHLPGRQKVQVFHRESFFILRVLMLAQNWIECDFNFSPEKMQQFLLKLNSDPFIILCLLIRQIF